MSERNAIMPTCCAPNCLRTEKNNRGYSFFSLPWKNKKRLDVWLKKLNLLYQPAPHAKICQFHFRPEFLHVDPKYKITPDLYPHLDFIE